jgi:hypothetical protein
MTTRILFVGAPALLLAGASVGVLLAQAPAAPPVPYTVGNRLGLPIEPTPAGDFAPMSPNVKVYGAIYSAESCSYDPVRNLIIVPNRGVPQNVQVNNAWVSLLNHDGSVHTARWIGVQAPGAPRAALTPPLVLNEPYGSDVAGGVLYLADRDGSTSPQDKGVAVIRRFTLATGAPAGATRVPAVEWFNDIAVAADGTVYGTVTGGATEADAATWQVWRVPVQGEASLVVQAGPLKRPNGIALDADGNLVVVNMLTPDVLTLSPDGRVLKTEQAAQAGNDGIVILRDGTKYVSSVLQGGISRIRPGQKADLIAQHIPNAASMCYDAGAHQLVIPMNANNAIALVPLERR